MRAGQVGVPWNPHLVMRTESHQGQDQRATPANIWPQIELSFQCKNKIFLESIRADQALALIIEYGK